MLRHILISLSLLVRLVVKKGTGSKIHVQNATAQVNGRLSVIDRSDGEILVY